MVATFVSFGVAPSWYDNDVIIVDDCSYLPLYRLNAFSGKLCEDDPLQMAWIKKLFPLCSRFDRGLLCIFRKERLKKAFQSLCTLIVGTGLVVV